MKKSKIARIIIGVCLVLTGAMILSRCFVKDKVTMVMGGTLYLQENLSCNDCGEARDDLDGNPLETGEMFFRPSNLPVLNNATHARSMD